MEPGPKKVNTELDMANIVIGPESEITKNTSKIEGAGSEVETGLEKEKTGRGNAERNENKIGEGGVKDGIEG